MIFFTSFYASVLTLIYVFLALRVMRHRTIKDISLGTGGDPELERMIRVHANFAEYVPLALILMIALELQFADQIVLHGIGILLIVARSVHAYGLSQVNDTRNFRLWGMRLTIFMMVVSSLLNFGYIAARIYLTQDAILQYD